MKCHDCIVTSSLRTLQKAGAVSEFRCRVGCRALESPIRGLFPVYEVMCAGYTPFTKMFMFGATQSSSLEISVSCSRFARWPYSETFPTLVLNPQVVELKSGGKDIPVTSANRIAYIHLVADYRLNRQIRPHCLAFRQGLANVVSLEWLRMFDQQEIQVHFLCLGTQFFPDMKIFLKIHLKFYNVNVFFRC